jgi:hypothetical protein
MVGKIMEWLSIVLFWGGWAAIGFLFLTKPKWVYRMAYRGGFRPKIELVVWIYRVGGSLILVTCLGVLIAYLITR